VFVREKRGGAKIVARKKTETAAGVKGNFGRGKKSFMKKKEKRRPLGRKKAGAQENEQRIEIETREIRRWGRWVMGDSGG